VYLETFVKNKIKRFFSVSTSRYTRHISISLICILLIKKNLIRKISYIKFLFNIILKLTNALSGDKMFIIIKLMIIIIKSLREIIVAKL